MKSKVLKIGTVLLACVCLISIFALPVSAATDDIIINYFTVWGTEPLYSDDISDSLDDFEVSYSTDLGNSIYCYLISAAGPYASFIDVQEKVEVGIYVGFLKAGSYEIDIAFEDCKVYSAYLDYREQEDQDKPILDVETVEMGNKTLDGAFYGTSKLKFEVPEINDRMILYLTAECIADNENSCYDMYFYNIKYLPDTTQQIIDNQNQNASEIIENQNENTQAIIDAQQQATQEQTDEIMNGWDGGVNVDDGTKDDFANAEDAALGGKSDAEIQEEVNNALNFDIGVFDTVKIGKIHSLFDNVLDALGSSWQSLFVLSLTLGLGAFLIGRRYG